MKYDKWLFAFLINILIGLLLLLLFYPSKNELGRGFTIAILFIFLRHISLYAGVIILVIEFIWLPKLSSSVLYLSFTILNLSVALAATILYFIKQADRAWLHDCLLNGLLGVLMLGLYILRVTKK